MAHSRTPRPSSCAKRRDVRCRRFWPRTAARQAKRRDVGCDFTALLRDDAQCARTDAKPAVHSGVYPTPPRRWLERSILITA
ncbi:hypothetical protein XAC3810_520106 [Xanthomonas citri pv. citri]|nr:hypothetical protein XAC3824_660200 [Xanthomonas citri pv. citri]CEE32555.1 hypothetical protein XAC1083_510201 [Xanthomonas citri pv. citri]CEE42073.1 hypothetical protein XAC3810_520106 [Xanthomonas citri pv. citri]CEE43936.1 hypothetical protein XAC902_680200 [Xanthomonas citri pv. citri]CEE64490.1 hypothetical protein XAC71A_730199 [Xanthomonas citri pv. citri]